MRTSCVMTAWPCDMRFAREMNTSHHCDKQEQHHFGEADTSLFTNDSIYGIIDISKQKVVRLGLTDP